MPGCADTAAAPRQYRVARYAAAEGEPIISGCLWMASLPDHWVL
jgi:hypothetical protein